MIAFRDITLQDKELISSFTLNSHRQNCDLSFSNLCSWRFKYNTQIAVLNEHHLAFKFWISEEQPVYMMPVGTGPLQEIIPQLVEDATDNQARFCMLGICTDMLEQLEAALPGQLQFSTDRDYSDYIYLRSDLAFLKGKKFQAKRNHINRFKNLYPDYRYSAITADRIQECLELEAAWCRQNNCNQQEGTTDERQAIIYALQHFEELGLQGGILEVGNQIIAFTFGMPINYQTFGVHAEKADTRFEGAYAMINQLFALQIPEQYQYINREEDLGIEGLRKAKLSYQPAIILDKHMACLKEKPVAVEKW